MSSNEDDALLARALQEDKEALGMLLEAHRSYLRLLALRELDPVVSSRLSVSDIVQQTFLEVHRDLRDFRGTSSPQFLSWLRQILLHNVAQATQTHVVARKRTVRRESSIDQSRAGVQPMRENLISQQSSPSSRAMRGEAAVRLARAMDRLPPDQCEAIRLRYLEGWSLATIANQMQRSEVAAAGLLKRGLRGLRGQLSDRV